MDEDRIVRMSLLLFAAILIRLHVWYVRSLQSEPSAYDTHQFLHVATALAAWGRIKPGDVVAAIATTWCEHVCWLATVATFAWESRSPVPIIHCDACSYTSIVSRTKTRVGLVRCMGTIACLLTTVYANGSDVCMRGSTYACLCAWHPEMNSRHGWCAWCDVYLSVVRQSPWDTRDTLGA